MRRELVDDLLEQAVLLGLAAERRAAESAHPVVSCRRAGSEGRSGLPISTGKKARERTLVDDGASRRRLAVSADAVAAVELASVGAAHVVSKSGSKRT